MTAEEHVKGFYALYNPTREDIIVEVVSVIRDLVIEINSIVISEENYILGMLYVLKTQNEKYLFVVDQVEKRFPFIGTLNRNAFFDFQYNLGGTWRDMVELYYSYNSDTILIKETVH